MLKNILFVALCTFPILAFAQNVSLGQQAMKKCMGMPVETTDVRNCIADANVSYTDAMNAKYKKRLKEAKQRDKEIADENRAEDMPYERQEHILESTLIASQAAFMQYMDKECSENGVGGAQHYGGSGPEYVSICEIDLISQRLITLDDEY